MIIQDPRIYFMVVYNLTT